MRIAFSLVQAIIGFALVGAIPTKDCTYAVKEKINAPHGWVLHGQPAPHHTVELKIALPQPNFNELERHLYEVSDPDHHRYGQHLSKEEVEELVAPHPESLATVNTWLGTFGLSEDEFIRSPAKDWISVKVPVSVAEKMMDTVRSCYDFVPYSTSD